MKKSHIPPGFLVYMVLISLWLLPIIAAPFLLMQNSPLAAPIYSAYGSAFICHQLNSRSLCYFPNTNSVADCTPDSSKLEFTKTQATTLNGNTGYKIPVCARDVGIYFAMLMGGVLVLALGHASMREWPSPWYLVLALIPMAIDGGTQALGWRESSNFLRLVTGFVTGIALPFYFVPLLNALLKAAKD